jgi:hypothetical protein
MTGETGSEDEEQPSNHGSISSEANVKDAEEKVVKKIDASSWGNVITPDEDPSLGEEATGSSGATGSTASSGSTGATGINDSEPVEDVIEDMDEHAAGDEATGPAAPEDGSAGGVLAEAETEREHYVDSLREQMKAQRDLIKVADAEAQTRLKKWMDATDPDKRQHARADVERVKEDMEYAKAQLAKLQAEGAALQARHVQEMEDITSKQKQCLTDRETHLGYLQQIREMLARLKAHLKTKPKDDKVAMPPKEDEEPKSKVLRDREMKREREKLEAEKDKQEQGATGASGATGGDEDADAAPVDPESAEEKQDRLEREENMSATEVLKRLHQHHQYHAKWLEKERIQEKTMAGRASVSRRLRREKKQPVALVHHAEKTAAAELEEVLSFLSMDEERVNALPSELAHTIGTHLDRTEARLHHESKHICGKIGEERMEEMATERETHESQISAATQSAAEATTTYTRLLKEYMALPVRKMTIPKKKLEIQRNLKQFKARLSAQLGAMTHVVRIMTNGVMAVNAPQALRARKTLKLLRGKKLFSWRVPSVKRVIPSAAKLHLPQWSLVIGGDQDKNHLISRSEWDQMAASCICPRDIVPVCAKNGKEWVTFGNPCGAMCQRNQGAYIVRDGKCSEGGRTWSVRDRQKALNRWRPVELPRWSVVQDLLDQDGDGDVGAKEYENFQSLYSA